VDLQEKSDVRIIQKLKSDQKSESQTQFLEVVSSQDKDELLKGKVDEEVKQL